MTVTLGFQPYSIKVLLARDSTFTSAIVGNEPWPDGIAVELRFATGAGQDTVWPAEVDGSTLSWTVPRSMVTPLVDGRASQVRLIYTTAEGEDLLWATGRVERV